MAVLFLVAGIALLVIGAAVACLPIFFTGQVVARWEGASSSAIITGAYVGYLFLAATQHDALPAFSTAMWTVVIPLTVLTLLGASIRECWGEATRRAATHENPSGSPPVDSQRCFAFVSQCLHVF
ncbi:hypothetical protein [Salinibacter ruber]|uniref:hypothetical protein n=1 Tax=Salinibacter ruber TaxID=146919 RepID=UPI00216807AD|nr:hypothetical protein [Salinibacter ruber]MCS3683664.1 hypothetical protein [Salinibacter ruber]MCS3853531.1 hypothetical protein [Salinibacter ruber]